MRLAFGDAGHFKRSLFQPLVPQDQSAWFPPERLDPVLSTIDKQEQVAIQHVHFKDRCDHAA